VNHLGAPEHALPEWAVLHEKIRRAGGSPCNGPQRDDWTGTEQQQRRAAQACLDCPALFVCALYAKAADEREGTWGGETASQRARRRKATA
jgi:hypothetical protein